jgi:hypothetical protein
MSTSSFPVGTDGSATVTVEIKGSPDARLENKPPADVVLVLDVSNSVDTPSFEQEKTFTVGAITNLRDVSISKHMQSSLHVASVGNTGLDYHHKSISKVRTTCEKNRLRTSLM